MTRRVFTTTTAGSYLGVSRPTIVKLTTLGLLHTLPGYVERRYSLGELERYANQSGAVAS